jgi:hypothetical protein
MLIDFLWMMASLLLFLLPLAVCAVTMLVVNAFAGRRWLD